MHDFDIRELTQLFYSDYPKDMFSEIVRKDFRPYDVVVFEMSPDYYVCIPFDQILIIRIVIVLKIQLEV